MIEDFTTTIKAQLYERVSSPLLSSFFISWCGWNYKFILILFSGMASHEKIVYIDLNIFPNLMSAVIHGALLPTLTSLLLIFVYPIPAEFIYRHVKINQRRLKEIQQSIDDESPLSKEQARKIRREALENQLKYETEIDAKNVENARLKEIISDLQQKMEKPNGSLVAEDVKPDSYEETDIKAEVLDEQDDDFLAAYKIARDEPSANNAKNAMVGTFNGSEEQSFDAFMRETLLDYLGGLKEFSNLQYDVSASAGKLKVLLGGPDGLFLPYVTSEYTRDTALEVLDTIKRALSSGSPPNINKSASKIGDGKSGPDFNVVKKLILKGFAAGETPSEIHSELASLGIPKSLIISVMEEVRRSNLGSHPET